ncbi:hypothetical protein X777_08465 [Ooceraea biroi]|uniref:Uncharacterized protein n=1 Tax=Ooceraea biroi TaxID=2015173 RepID=A0A026WYZ8_OOCBI|nr:hypothetical protein X777_08465 [Ooceraea biroi]
MDIAKVNGQTARIRKEPVSVCVGAVKTSNLRTSHTFDVFRRSNERSLENVGIILRDERKGMNVRNSSLATLARTGCSL